MTTPTPTKQIPKEKPPAQTKDKPGSRGSIPREKSAAPKATASQDIVRMVNDSQRLMTYMAQAGDLTLPEEVTARLVNAKYKLARDQWTEVDESEFILSYDLLAEQVYPVTIESIQATCPDPIHQEKTKAEKAVKWYRRYTMVALILLLVAQIYWLVGYDLHNELQMSFKQRAELRAELQQLNTMRILAPENFAQSSDKQQKLIVLEDQEQSINQILDANYKLLLVWNKVWSLGQDIKGEYPQYLSAKFQLDKEDIELLAQTDPLAAKQQLKALTLGRELHEARITLFANTLAASFTLNAFQGYLLPLLYGLLGAFIFVLRTLLREVKSLTYSFDSEIRYRLRLTLGALGGMIVGWFLKPENAEGLASLSPMALSFLMGYNVDVLFSIMDRAIDNIRAWTESGNNTENKKELPKDAETPPEK